MSSYNPPVDNLTVFSTTLFKESNTLTLSQADKRYLKFPLAQGTENFQSINVLGTTTSTDLITANGGITTTNLKLNTTDTIKGILTRTEANNSSGSGTISFGVTFQNPPSVVGTMIVNSGGLHLLMVYNITTTQFSYRSNFQFNANNTSASNVPFNWIAIGK